MKKTHDPDNYTGENLKATKNEISIQENKVNVNKRGESEALFTKQKTRNTVDNEYNNEYIEIPPFKAFLDKAEAYLQKNEIQQSLESYEKVLKLVFEVKGKEVFEINFEKIVKKLSNFAMGLLNKGDTRNSLKILTKCEEFSNTKEGSKAPGAVCITYNHLGCYHRRTGKLDIANSYFSKALNCIKANNMSKHVGLTHMNMSAMYSQIGKHEEALKYSRRAVKASQSEIIEMLKGKDVDEVKRSKDYEEIIIVLGISLHNMGNEQEYFEMEADALNSYEKSLEVFIEHLGENHKLTTKFKRHLVMFYEKYLEKKKKNSSTPNKNKSIDKKLKIPEENQVKNLDSKLTELRKRIKRSKRPKSMPKPVPPANQMIRVTRPGKLAYFTKVEPYLTAYKLVPNDFYFVGNQVMMKSESHTKLGVASNPSNLIKRPLNINNFVSYGNSKNISVTKSLQNFKSPGGGFRINNPSSQTGFPEKKFNPLFKDENSKSNDSFKNDLESEGIPSDNEQTSERASTKIPYLKVKKDKSKGENLDVAKRDLHTVSETASVIHKQDIVEEEKKKARPESANIYNYVKKISPRGISKSFNQPKLSRTSIFSQNNRASKQNSSPSNIKNRKKKIAAVMKIQHFLRERKNINNNKTTSVNVINLKTIDNLLLPLLISTSINRERKEVLNENNVIGSLNVFIEKENKTLVFRYGCKRLCRFFFFFVLLEEVVPYLSIYRQQQFLDFMHRFSDHMMRKLAVLDGKWLVLKQMVEQPNKGTLIRLIQSKETIQLLPINPLQCKLILIEGGPQNLIHKTNLEAEKNSFDIQNESDFSIHPIMEELRQHRSETPLKDISEMGPLLSGGVEFENFDMYENETPLEPVLRESSDVLPVMIDKYHMEIREDDRESQFEEEEDENEVLGPVIKINEKPKKSIDELEENGNFEELPVLVSKDENRKRQVKKSEKNSADLAQEDLKKIIKSVKNGNTIEKQEGGEDNGFMEEFDVYEQTDDNENLVEKLKQLEDSPQRRSLAEKLKQLENGENLPSERDMDDKDNFEKDMIDSVDIDGAKANAAKHEDLEQNTSFERFIQNKTVNTREKKETEKPKTKEPVHIRKINGPSIHSPSYNHSPQMNATVVKKPTTFKLNLKEIHLKTSTKPNIEKNHSAVPKKKHIINTPIVKEDLRSSTNNPKGSKKVLVESSGNLQGSETNIGGGSNNNTPLMGFANPLPTSTRNLGGDSADRFKFDSIPELTKNMSATYIEPSATTSKKDEGKEKIVKIHIGKQDIKLNEVDMDNVLKIQRFIRGRICRFRFLILLAKTYTLKLSKMKKFGTNVMWMKIFKSIYRDTFYATFTLADENMMPQNYFRAKMFIQAQHADKIIKSSDPWIFFCIKWHKDTVVLRNPEKMNRMIYLVKKMWTKGRQEKWRLAVDALKLQLTKYLIENRLFLPIENAILRRLKLMIASVKEKAHLKYCYIRKIQFLDSLLADIPRRNGSMGFDEMSRNWKHLNKILEKIQIVENIKKYYIKRVPLKESLEKLKISCGIEGHYFIYTHQINLKGKTYNLHLYYSANDFMLIANCGNIENCNYKEPLEEPRANKMSIEEIKDLIIRKTTNITIIPGPKKYYIVNYNAKDIHHIEKVQEYFYRRKYPTQFAVYVRSLQLEAHILIGKKKLDPIPLLLLSFPQKKKHPFMISGDYLDYIRTVGTKNLDYLITKELSISKDNEIVFEPRKKRNYEIILHSFQDVYTDSSFEISVLYNKFLKKLVFFSALDEVNNLETAINRSLKNKDIRPYAQNLMNKVTLVAINEHFWLIQLEEYQKGLTNKSDIKCLAFLEFEKSMIKGRASFFKKKKVTQYILHIETFDYMNKTRFHSVNFTVEVKDSRHIFEKNFKKTELLLENIFYDCEKGFITNKEEIIAFLTNNQGELLKLPNRRISSPVEKNLTKRSPNKKPTLNVKKPDFFRSMSIHDVNKKQEIRLDPDERELNSAALFIQKQYRNKKQVSRKESFQIQNPKTEDDEEMPRDHTQLKSRFNSKQNKFKSPEDKLDVDESDSSNFKSTESRYMEKGSQGNALDSKNDTYNSETMRPNLNIKEIKESVIIEGDPDELNRAASFIQHKYRARNLKSSDESSKPSSNLPSTLSKVTTPKGNSSSASAALDSEDTVKKDSTLELDRNIKSSQELLNRKKENQKQKNNLSERVVIEDEDEELNKAATMIQRGYRKKKSNSPKKNDKSIEITDDVNDEATKRPSSTKSNNKDTNTIVKNEASSKFPISNQDKNSQNANRKEITPGYQRIENEKIEIEGDPAELNRAAAFIQNKYRKKKSPEKKDDVKLDNNLREKNKKDAKAPKGEVSTVVSAPKDLNKINKEEVKTQVKANEEPIVIEGDPEELNQAASFIQARYKKKLAAREASSKENEPSSKAEPSKKGEGQPNEKATNNAIQKQAPKEGNSFREKQPVKEAEKVEIEGDPEELNKAALLIQQKYKKKKSKSPSPEKGKTKEKVEKNETKDKKEEAPAVQKPVMSREKVAVEGDPEELNKAAAFIQKKYKSRNKSPNPEEKQNSKANGGKAEEKKELKDSAKWNSSKQIEKKIEGVQTEGVFSRKKDNEATNKETKLGGNKEGAIKDIQKDNDENIIIEGDPEELNRAALLIQQKYKKRNKSKDNPNVGQESKLKGSEPPGSHRESGFNVKDHISQSGGTLRKVPIEKPGYIDTKTDSKKDLISKELSQINEVESALLIKKHTSGRSEMDSDTLIKLNEMVESQTNSSSNKITKHRKRSITLGTDLNYYSEFKRDGREDEKKMSKKSTSPKRIKLQEDSNYLQSGTSINRNIEDSRETVKGDSIDASIDSPTQSGEKKKRHTVVVNPSFIEKLDEKSVPAGPQGKSTRPFWSKKKISSLDVNKLETILSRSKSLTPPLVDAQIMETDPDELDLASRIVLLRQRKKQDDNNSENLHEEASLKQDDTFEQNWLNQAASKDSSPTKVDRKSIYKIKIHRPIEDFKRAVMFLQHFYRYRFYLRHGKYFMNEKNENEENNSRNNSVLNQANIWG